MWNIVVRTLEPLLLEKFGMNSCSYKDSCSCLIGITFCLIEDNLGGEIVSLFMHIVALVSICFSCVFGIGSEEAYTEFVWIDDWLQCPFVATG